MPVDNMSIISGERKGFFNSVFQIFILFSVFLSQSGEESKNCQCVRHVSAINSVVAQTDNIFTFFVYCVCKFSCRVVYYSIIMWGLSHAFCNGWQTTVYFQQTVLNADWVKKSPVFGRNVFWKLVSAHFAGHALAGLLRMVFVNIRFFYSNVTGQVGFCSRSLWNRQARWIYGDPVMITMIAATAFEMPLLGISFSLSAHPVSSTVFRNTEKLSCANEVSASKPLVKACFYPPQIFSGINSTNFTTTKTRYPCALSKCFWQILQPRSPAMDYRGCFFENFQKICKKENIQCSKLT